VRGTARCDPKRKIGFRFARWCAFSGLLIYLEGVVVEGSDGNEPFLPYGSLLISCFLFMSCR
jgi:hypothetical protein